MKRKTKPIISCMLKQWVSFSSVHSPHFPTIGLSKTQRERREHIHMSNIKALFHPLLIILWLGLGRNKTNTLILATIHLIPIVSKWVLLWAWKSWKYFNDERKKSQSYNGFYIYVHNIIILNTLIK